jgi:hypothetical protein
MGASRCGGSARRMGRRDLLKGSDGSLSGGSNCMSSLVGFFFIYMCRLVNSHRSVHLSYGDDSFEGFGFCFDCVCRSSCWSILFTGQTHTIVLVIYIYIYAASLCFDLKKAEETPQEACTIHRTKHPGNASVAIHDNGKVCAVGGWDGK